MTVATGQPQQSTHGKKSKVFWIQPCATQPLVSAAGVMAPAGMTDLASSGGVAATGAAGQSEAGASVQPAAAKRNASSPTEVLGLSVTRSPARPGATSAAALPFTGAEIGGLAAAALAALGGGAALTVVGRRRARRLSPTS
jgi:hypothetical protein